VCGLMAVIFSLAFVTCDNGGGTGNNPGNNPQRGNVTYTGNNGSDTYTLVITENTSRAYAPVNGDTYKLTLTGGKTSTGTIEISGGTITLTPLKEGGTITVTVSGTSIVSITGTGLKWDDDAVFTAPGTLSNSKVGNPYLGNKLELSGQVYVAKMSEDGTSISYEKFDGDLELSRYNSDGGSGEVKDGQLSYTIETPTNLYTLDNRSWEEWNDVKFSDDTVKYNHLPFFWTGGEHSPLFRGNITAANVVGNTVSGTRETVLYVYVDGDVTFSGKGKTIDTDSSIWGAATTISITSTSKDFSLPLKAGWNVIYEKGEESSTFTGTWESNLASPSLTGTRYTTMSLGEPSGLKWFVTSN